MPRYRFRRLILTALLLFTLWHMTACRHAPVLMSQVACHSVTHTAGITCVPNKVERLVTLDISSFENAIALGLKPVGTVSSQLYASHLQSQLVDVESIGQAGAPKLERVLALKPDLIVGQDDQRSFYPQSSRIAPTVLLESGSSGEWKETFQSFSTALNHEETYQQVMDAYDRRVQDFKRRLVTDPDSRLPSSPQISVARVYQDSINLYLRDSFLGTILQDAGLARPTTQDISAAEASRLFDNEIQVAISLEQLDRADGDVLFIWTADNTAQAAETSRKNLAKLQLNPLWKHLSAVQNHRVHFVPSYWSGSGVIAANALIDDLFKYLINVDSVH